MAKVVLGVTVSVDGYAEDRAGSVSPLYSDLDTLRDTDLMREVVRNTGAVVMAWKEFAMAKDPDGYVGNYEFQVPIFVFTDKAPKKHPKEGGGLTFTFVTDGVASAVRKAKAAAKSKDVQVIGSARTVQLFLKEGLADELQVDVMPVFLHAGSRPFDNIGTTSISLERTRVVELPGGRTHLRFRITRPRAPHE